MPSSFIQKRPVLAGALWALVALIVVHLLFAPWGLLSPFAEDALARQTGALFLLHVALLAAAGYALRLYVRRELGWGAFLWLLLIFAGLPGLYAMAACPDFDRPIGGEPVENPAAKGIPHPVYEELNITITPYRP